MSETKWASAHIDDDGCLNLFRTGTVPAVFSPREVEAMRAALVEQAGGVEVTLSCPGPFYQVYASGINDMAFGETRRALLLPLEAPE